MKLDRIAVVGAGAWGTALANVAARAGRTVTLIARNAAMADEIVQGGESPRLPGIALHRRVSVTGSLAEVGNADAVLLVVPAQQSAAVAVAMAGLVRRETPVVACAKGIERAGRRFMTEVIVDCIPGALPAILSGPSFATDVARGLPTAVTLAAREKREARAVAHALATPKFRPYHSIDVLGVQIGGAAKNVLAIAAGIVAGRRLGASAGAALTTRGFAELMRFGRAFGAKSETLTGLSGLGDLILTCSTAQSRNFSLGIALGEGRGPHPEDEGEKLAEGAFTASALVEMAAERGVDMPIAAAVTAVLDGSLSVDGAIDALLTRPLRSEH